MFKLSKLTFLKPTFLYQNTIMNFATKMRQGATKNNKDSAGRRLGVKKFEGEEVLKNDIIIRQRGLKWKPGENIIVGRDHTLLAKKEGVVKFTKDPWAIKRRRVFVHVVEQEVPNRILSPPKPFMYHPELFPELAKNNAVNAAPFEIKVPAQKRPTKNKLEGITVSKTNFKMGEMYDELSSRHERIQESDFTNNQEVTEFLQHAALIAANRFIPSGEDDFNNEVINYNKIQDIKNIPDKKVQRYLLQENFSDMPLLTDTATQRDYVYGYKTRSKNELKLEAIRKGLIMGDETRVEEEVQKEKRLRAKYFKEMSKSRLIEEKSEKTETA